jgi:2,3-dihydroxybenzoate decarboxylase
MKKIAVEEHIRQEGFEHIEERLEDMDDAGIDVQVLSSGMRFDKRLDASDPTSLAKRINNELAEVVKRYPERFASFAVLALENPDTAADELERAVKKLGFKGTLIGPEMKEGEYLDNQKYWVLLEMAEKLDVPIYLHPGMPAHDMIKPYLTYPILARSMWGFAAQAGLHAMRLICSGIFDRYPNLKIILGHMGEGIPYFLWRLENRWLKEKDGWGEFEADPTASKLKRSPSQYFKDNFYVTTSGMFFQPALMCAYLALGADKILFAVDYPPESCNDAVQFIESMPISDIDKEKICHLNAEKLLRL